jgi:hypothetical protein
VTDDDLISQVCMDLCCVQKELHGFMDNKLSLSLSVCESECVGGRLT